MKQAMDRAGVSPEEVDYVNAHGTGARRSDEAEAEAMEKVFFESEGKGSRKGSAEGRAVEKGPAISGTKAATGHMMGACGITEVITCIKVMEEGILPPTLNLEDPIAAMDFVREKRKGVKVRVAMSNAFGFGGQNATIILRRYE